jgi:hypothetical protein
MGVVECRWVLMGFGWVWVLMVAGVDDKEK